MDLRKLTYFVTIAECGSFTRAAQQLHIAQPALSRQIKLLEQELGLDLLLRMGRQIRMTDAGEVLLAHAKDLIADFKRVEEDMQSRQRRPKGKVVIGAPPSLGPLVVPQVVARAARELPQITLRIREATSVVLEQWLDDAEIDVALLGSEPAVQHKNATKVTDEEIALIGRGDLLRAVNGTHSLCETIPLILTGQANALIRPIFCCAGVEIPEPLEIDALHVIKEIILRGHGITVLPIGLFRPEIERGAMAAARFNGVNLSRSIYIASSQMRPRSQAVEAIAGVLRAEVEELAQSRALTLGGMDVPRWDSLRLRMIEPASGSRDDLAALIAPLR
jgi:LysR family nitrogen assimilation transcriptional regulator